MAVVLRLERFLVPIFMTSSTKTLTMNNSFVFFANYYCFCSIFGWILADGSFEYTDSTGTDLHDFIIKTLKNPRWAYTPFFDLYKNSILLFSWPLAGFVLGSPEFKSSAMLVNSQLVHATSYQLGFLAILYFILVIGSLSLKSPIGERLLSVHSFIHSFIHLLFFFLPICRDRKFLMRLEQDFLNFIQDPA